MSKPELRTLQFSQVDEALSEVDRLANRKVETVGQHSFGKIVEHLARTLDLVTGHVDPPFTISLSMRLMGRLMRPLILGRPMKPGFKLPSNAESYFWPPGEIDAADAVQHFREALARFKAAESLPKHPFFGNMTRQQHDTLQCRHFALHLSFVKPIA